MMYRYISGVYQVGDLSALNYVKGFLDGRSSGRRPGRVLTVSGHGIGEAETWFVERMDGCQIDTVSFRLIDTQLLQFLRVAETQDIDTVFSKFSEIVRPYPALSELVSDPGLVPYWCEQAKETKRLFHRRQVTVFSDSPLCIPSTNLYDLIYVSHGSRHFSAEAAGELRKHLSPQGWLAILMPAQNGDSDERTTAHTRFANSQPVQEAKALFKKLLEERGYAPAKESMPRWNLAPLAARREGIRFSVLAPAKSVVIGELILSSLYEHISDRTRLEVLNETASQFKELHVPPSEELELFILEVQP
jgi:hypothetical protein